MSTSFLGGLGNWGASLGLPGVGDASKIYGTKPITPVLGDEVKKAIADSQAALPGAEKLATDVNAFTAEQKNRMLSFVDPDWQKNFSLEGDQIAKMMRGELPASDIAMQQLASVSHAISGGFGEGQGRTNLVARDLGIDQLKVTEAGLAANERWMAMADKLAGPLFDFTKMFPTPQEEMQTDWQKNLIAAAPDPVARGESDAWNQLIGEVLSIYGGGAGYTGTYKPNYGGGGGGGSGGGGGGGFWYTPAQSGTDVNIYNSGGSGTSQGQDVNIPDFANLV